MSKQVVSEQDRRRKKALIVFQVVIYSYLWACSFFNYTSILLATGKPI